MRVALACTVLLFALEGGVGPGLPARAQTPGSHPTEARLDAVVQAYAADNSFMGAVLVAQGDRVLLNKGYGKAVVEWDIPNTGDVKFRLGSLTKQFTATLVLLLQQEGRLDLAEPVSKYLPDAPASWSRITVADLLGHTSGIPNFTSDPAFMTWRMTPHSPEEILAFFRSKPLDFEPGSRFDYSNSNYEVLGVIAEKVTGKHYGDLLQERIFQPLGMKDTGLDRDGLLLPKRAEGYAGEGKALAPAVSESMTVPWAAGSVYSTTGDLLRWERGLFGLKILNAASLKRMTTPGKGKYCLGVFATEHDGVRTVEHGGGIEGFNTYLLEAPEQGITVVALSNINSAAPDSMAPKLLDVVLGKPVVLPSEHTGVPIAAAELGHFVGAYKAPQFGLTVALAAGGNGLTVQGPILPPAALLYEGVKNGHPQFYMKAYDAELEFVPDSGGKIATLLVHLPGQEVVAQRQ